MSLKRNVLVEAAAEALGVVVEAGAVPVCEALLNDKAVESFGIAEVDAAGRVLVVVGVKNEAGTVVNRPVCDAKGDVKVFGAADAAVNLAKKSKLVPGVVVQFVKLEKVAAIGDPVAALKAKHKAYKNESVQSVKAVQSLTGKINAAQGLGWNDAADGTPEKQEFDDLGVRYSSVVEWDGVVSRGLLAMTAALEAAGINPVTYLPMPPTSGG